LNAKTLFIYSISYFYLGGLGALFGGLSPPKPSRGDGTGHDTQCLVHWAKNETAAFEIVPSAHQKKWRYIV